MGFHLASLLELRCSAEEEAKQVFAKAAAARADAEAEQHRLREDVTRMREHRTSERARLCAQAPTSAADGVARERYRQRLRAAVIEAEEVAARHRDGPLAQAMAAERAACDSYARARQDREALDKLKARAEAEERRLAERRAEDAAGDLAQAAFARRSRPR